MRRKYASAWSAGVMGDFDSQASWLSALVVVASGLLIGGTIGSLAGGIGGKVDAFLMRVVDVMLAVPGILLAIGIVAILGGGMANVIIAVSIFSIPTFERLVRGTDIQQIFGQLEVHDANHAFYLGKELARASLAMASDISAPRPRPGPVQPAVPAARAGSACGNGCTSWTASTLTT